MRLRVPVNVEAIGSVITEQQFLEECLELYFDKSVKHGNISLLSIKLVAMGSEFKVPEALELLTQVLVFLWDCGLDGIDICSELFICHILDLDPHPRQVYIKSLTNVQAVLCGWLDKEPAAYDVAGAARAREHNVAELLLHPQLIVGWFHQKLHGYLAQQVILIPILLCLTPILVERD